MFATSTKTATFLLTKFSCMGFARPARERRFDRRVDVLAQCLPAGHCRARERSAHARTRFDEAERFPARQLGRLRGHFALEEHAAFVAGLTHDIAQQGVDDAAELV